MLLQADQEIVKTGTFLYDGLVTCDVIIVRGPVLFGSGDAEDPPELAEDREQETFYIWYGSTTARGHFNAGGARTTLAEAMKVVEEAPGIGSAVRWID
ncbi:hypothetical protein LQ564_11290 [Massilia sp. G4R7]|uniref:Uncharacterized protein n=1 Tax=Massilia phyllostachyos TaxID=2898585 RepID=A0ABS8Q8F8_9BURK|nr:hypothetical protein [Massilia phyllostachyos]MCD2516890.1 hypothetical protein [Massilia phyllostachyos]